MSPTIRQSDLEGYLDEALPAEEMARIEKALRDDPALMRQAGTIQSRRNAGLHTLGEIWRASRLSCLSREQLGSSLLGVLPDELADYVKFHIETVGCRCCQANLADLQQEQAEHSEKAKTRRRRYFESSVGHLRDGTPE